MEDEKNDELTNGFKRTETESALNMAEFLFAVAEELRANPEFDIQVSLQMIIAPESMEITEKICEKIFGEEVIYADKPVNIPVMH